MAAAAKREMQATQVTYTLYRGLSDTEKVEALFRSAEAVRRLLDKADDLCAHGKALDRLDHGGSERNNVDELPTDRRSTQALVRSLYEKAKQLHDWHGIGTALEYDDNERLHGAVLELQKWCLASVDGTTRAELLRAQDGRQEQPGAANGTGADDSQQKTRLSKEALIAAVAGHLRVNPTASSEEIAKRLRKSDSRIRQVWGPAREMALSKRAPWRKGYVLVDEDGSRIEVAVDESNLCPHCQTPMAPEWTCDTCGETVSDVCKDCHKALAGHE